MLIQLMRDIHLASKRPSIIIYMAQKFFFFFLWVFLPFGCTLMLVYCVVIFQDLDVCFITEMC
jgi:hypothetical protein